MVRIYLQSKYKPIPSVRPFSRLPTRGAIALNPLCTRQLSRETPTCLQVSVTLVAQPITYRKEDRVLCYTISLSHEDIIDGVGARHAAAEKAERAKRLEHSPQRHAGCVRVRQARFRRYVWPTLKKYICIVRLGIAPLLAPMATAVCLVLHIII